MQSVSTSEHNHQESHQDSFNQKAEQEILGALLFDNQNLEEAIDKIRPNFFYYPLHGLIYEKIILLAEKTRVADILTVESQISTEDSFIEAGGRKYLVGLVSSYTYGSFNIRERISIIRDCFLRRVISQEMQGFMAEISTNFEQTAEVHLQNLESKIYQIADQYENNSNDLESLSPILQRSFQSIKNLIENRENNEISGIESKFSEIDKKMGGFHNSDLLIIAGRPSMGKTSFAISIAMNAATVLYQKNQKRLAKAKELEEESGNFEKPKQEAIAVFSLEMSSEQLANRIIACESNFSPSSYNTGNGLDKDSYSPDGQIAKLQEVIENLEKLPIYIDDTPAITIETIRSKARRLKRRNGLSMIIIDYLQLIRTSQNFGMNRVNEVSMITQSLKNIAKELDVPVIALSQLSRAVEQREDKRPQLSDLRESGSIEQDADIVMFLYREEYYLERSFPNEPDDPQESVKWHNEFADKIERLNEVRGQSEIIIAKHRNGSVGSVKLAFDSETTRFSDWEWGED